MTLVSKAEGLRTNRWARTARWVLTVLTALLFVFAYFSQPEELPSVDDSERIRIEGMRPLELSPGATLAIDFSGHEVDGEPIRVSIDKQPASVLRRTEQTIVVRVPLDLEEGRANVRVYQGKERSKKRDVWLRPLDMARVVQMGVLGIALLVLGLRTLARGIRTYAGNRLREGFGRLSAGRWRSMALGTLLGGATQSTTASAGVLVGLLGSNLVSRSMALAVIFGAQVGAAVMGLVFPLGTQVAVVLVAIGVIWVSLSDNRHARSLAKVLLGLGLLFFGFETVRVGFHPLVASPLYVESWVSGGTALNAVLAAGLGALMTGLLQGPGPTLVLVLGLVESMEHSGLERGLSILAGIPLGVSLAAATVAWPFGGGPRKWAKAHLVLGLLATVVLAASTPLWIALADSLFPRDVQGAALARQVILPVAAPHLITTFLVSQAAVAGVVVLLLPFLRRFVEPVRRARPSLAVEQRSVSAGVLLNAALRPMQQALEHVYEIWSEGDRTNASGAEQSLEQAKRELTALLGSSRASTAASATALFSATLALLKAREDLSTMQRLVERGMEKDIAPERREAEALRRLHDWVCKGLESLAGLADSPSPGDLDSAREREIWLNAEDARTREALQARRTELDLEYVRHWSSVSAAYEQFGNQLFRAADALLHDADDD